MGADVQAAPKCKTAPGFPWDVYSKAEQAKESNKSHFKQQEENTLASDNPFFMVFRNQS